jgi:hypothetical protein
VTNNQYSGAVAKPKHDETFLRVGVLVVEKLASVFIIEHGPCLLERDTVFPAIASGLRGVPLELNHTYIV